MSAMEVRRDHSYVTRTELADLDTLCHGQVTRGGELDACNKPACAVVYDIEFSAIWPACVWHAHRYGTGVTLTLAQMREAEKTGATRIDYEMREYWS